MEEVPETSGYYGRHEEPHRLEAEPEVDFEEMCIECSGRGSIGCGCCGARLCHMHQETQAGFCSNFGTYEIDGEEKTGCKIGDDFYEFENPMNDNQEEASE